MRYLGLDHDGRYVGRPVLLGRRIRRGRQCDEMGLDWVAYLILQLVCIAYSWVACTYLFPRFPTIKGIPYFLLAFGTALLICLIPFCTDFGKQFADLPHPVLYRLWQTVCGQRADLGAHLVVWSKACVREHRPVPCHVRRQGRLVLAPIADPESARALHHDLPFRWMEGDTHPWWKNLDAASSFCIGLPVALICGIVNDDNNTGIKVIAWIA